MACTGSARGLLIEFQSPLLCINMLVVYCNLQGDAVMRCRGVSGLVAGQYPFRSESCALC